MPFQKYDPKQDVMAGVKPHIPPQVSITVESMLSLNMPALAVASVTSEKEHRVDLFYDSENKLLGIKINDIDGALPIKIFPASARIKAARFITRFGLAKYRRRIYRAAWDENQDMLVLDLDGEYEEIRAGRPRVNPDPQARVTVNPDTMQGDDPDPSGELINQRVDVIDPRTIAKRQAEAEQAVPAFDPDDIPEGDVEAPF